MMKVNIQTCFIIYFYYLRSNLYSLKIKNLSISFAEFLSILVKKIYQSLSTQLFRLKEEVVEIKNMLSNLQTNNKENKNTDVEFESEAEEDGHTFPIKTYNKFKVFDLKLKIDQTYKTKILLFILSII